MAGTDERGRGLRPLPRRRSAFPIGPPDDGTCGEEDLLTYEELDQLYGEVLPDRTMLGTPFPVGNVSDYLFRFSSLPGNRRWGAFTFH